MQLPCSVCGTILQVHPDTEYIYCTMCGTRVELGVHSYRTEGESKKAIYCISCDQRLNPDAIGTIFSCDTCNEHVCSICAKLYNNKHYCPECYTKLIPKLKKPKKAPPKKKKETKKKKPSEKKKETNKGKPSKRKKPSKKKTSTGKAKRKEKAKSNVKYKSKQKGKSKVKIKSKGKTKSKNKKK